MIFQHNFGSRFFIPKIFRPSYFNYYQTYIVYSNNLPDDEDCCICMQHLHEDPEQAKKQSFGAIQRLLTDENNIDQPQITLSEPLLNQDEEKQEKLETMKSQIMVTPCKHKFHPICLKSWMNIKLICPACRTPLPSLE